MELGSVVEAPSRFVLEKRQVKEQGRAATKGMPVRSWC